MANDGWDSHPLGGASVFPVVGVSVASAMGGKAGALRIEYGTEPTLQTRKAMQFLLSPAQARAMSQRLSDLADKLEASGGSENGQVAN